MASSSIPSDFDWVSARAEYSVIKVFARLATLAERDVAKKNTLHPNTAAFEAEDQSFGVYGVYADASKRKRAQFTLDGNRIIVGGHVDLVITLTLDNGGNCKCRIDGEGEFELWQVLRRALEPVLFP